MRITNDDMQEATVAFDRKKPTTPQETKTFVYTLIGYEDELVDDSPVIYDRDGRQADSLPAACAKEVLGQKSRYFIRQSENGRFYNPLGLYDEFQQQHNKQLKHAMSETWKYKEVNHMAFTQYLSFLKTKNLSWFKNAERETF